MGIDSLGPAVGILLVLAVIGWTAFRAYRIRVERMHGELGSSRPDGLLELRSEVIAHVDRGLPFPSLTLTNIGGMGALEVELQATWEIGREGVRAISEFEGSRLPLSVLPAGGKAIFRLDSFSSKNPRLFVKLRWREEEGSLRRRTFGL